MHYDPARTNTIVIFSTFLRPHAVHSWRICSVYVWICVLWNAVREYVFEIIIKDNNSQSLWSKIHFWTLKIIEISTLEKILREKVMERSLFDGYQFLVNFKYSKFGILKWCLKLTFVYQKWCWCTKVSSSGYSKDF